MQVGEKLGIPKNLYGDSRSPGPGLGVRIIGEITADKVKVLQDADWVLQRRNGKETDMRKILLSSSAFFLALKLSVLWATTELMITLLQSVL